MNIPKAKFLQQSWLRNKASVEKQAHNEAILVRGVLTNTLRNPQTHKQGTFSQFFDVAEYPLLGRGAYPEHITTLQKEFEAAGYEILLEQRNNGFTISIDWRNADISSSN